MKSQRCVFLWKRQKGWFHWNINKSMISKVRQTSTSLYSFLLPRLKSVRKAGNVSDFFGNMGTLSLENIQKPLPAVLSRDKIKM
ncbi:hypothetical protein D3Z38_00985 [Clostridiales bacterium]|nr:hypothetical protein [Clostridiales bacterium]